MEGFSSTIKLHLQHEIILTYNIVKIKKKDYFYSKINNKLFEKLNEDINQPSPSTFRFSEFNSINNHYYPIKRNSKSNLLLNQKPKSIHHLTSPNSISTTNIYSKSKIRKQIHKTENNFNTNNIIIRIGYYLI